ncbi:MAG: HAAS signaling domain-containing protein [Promethearchaeota archaeon]
MSYKVEKEEMVKDFLKDVEEKLPGWIKEDKKELKDVLNELEEHLWDKAAEIAEQSEPTIGDMQEAINQMGTPKSIAGEYKKRGTPKIFISEEFWPFYIKVLQILIAIIVGANILGFVLGMFGGNLLEIAFSELFTGLWSGIITPVFIVTVIFVYLSMEGYLPEEFMKKTVKKRKKDSSGAQQQQQRYGVKKIKPPLKMTEFLSEGIAAIIFGVLLIVQPISPINEFLGPKLLSWLAIAGIFDILGGIAKLMHVLIGQQAINGQRILIGVCAVLDIIFIPLLSILSGALQAIPGLSELESEVQVIVFQVFGYIPLLITIGYIIGIAVAVYKILTLKAKYENYRLNN